MDLGRGESFGFLGFDFRRIRSRRGAWRANYTPKLKKRTALLAEAQGCVPPLPIATSGSGRAVDQPDTTRLGELLCGGAFQRVLQLHQRLGRKEGSAPHAAGRKRKGFGWTRWSRQWLYETLRAVQRLQGSATAAESRPGRIGPISLGAKQTGERSAGNPHAAFDEAGAGNVAWSRWCDTRRRKGETTGNTNFDLNRRASPRPY